MLIGHIDAQEIHLLRRFSVQGPGDLKQFKSDPEAIRNLTVFLKEREMNPAYSAAGAAPPANLLADLIASGEALVGTGQPQLLWRHAVSSWDKSSALTFLRRCSTSPSAMWNLRYFLWKGTASPDFARIDDRRILEQAASWVSAGEAVVGFRVRLRGGGGAAEDAPARPQPVAIPVPSPSSRTEREREPDPATFVPHHDAAMQAQALIAAAQEGVPFCEECEKARVERAKAGAGKN